MKRGAWAVGAALALVAALRLAGLRWGLPQTFNADEPHLVHLALSFGGGSLRPYLFKYPTLWPYVLFAVYGLYFAFWSGFGLLRSPEQFLALFHWDPTWFYLLGRGLAAACTVLGPWLLWRWREEQGLEPDEGRAMWAWAPLLLGASPVLNEAGHGLKPDALMFLCACGAWHYALEAFKTGGRRAFRASGLLAGLAISCQYTAFPLLTLPALAWALGRPRASFRSLLEAAGFSILGFAAGSPYALLDPGLFWASMKDLDAFWRITAPGWSRLDSARAVARNLADLAALGPAASLAALAGACWTAWSRPRLAALLLGPVGVYTAMLVNNPDGGWHRYMLGAYPGLALLAALGLRRADGGSWPRRALLAAAVLAPGLWRSAALDRELRLPDTRTQASAWLAANAAPGSAVLLDAEHASPRAAMSREQLLALAEKAAAEGSPKARLYRAAAAGHPGGGFTVLRLKRSAEDLRSGPGHVRFAQAGAPLLDVSAGVAAARAAGVGLVVTSSYGATPARAPELARFFDELERSGPPAARFSPAPGRAAGPELAAYRLTSSARR